MLFLPSSVGSLLHLASLQRLRVPAEKPLPMLVLAVQIYLIFFKTYKAKPWQGWLGNTFQIKIGKKKINASKTA